MQKTVEKRLKRSEVPVEHTWNLEDLFSTEEQWEGELHSIENDFSSVTQFKGKLHTGAKVLLNCFTAEEKLQMRVIRVTTYASLRSSEDGSNPVNQANSSLVAGMLAKLGAALSFIESEILSLPEGTVEKYLQEEAELAVFKNKLQDLLEKKKYVLSPEVEELLASLSEIHSSPYTIYQLGKSSDMQFESIDDNGNELPMSFALYEDRYELSPDVYKRQLQRDQLE